MIREYHSVFSRLKECIIVTGTFQGENIYLVKNRDRAYDPNVSIIREVRDGVEAVYLLDNDTGWSEGMNEFGIGVTNTALQVGHDEKEKVIVKKTGVRSKDGKIVRKNLFYDNLESMLDGLIEYKSGEYIGVHGHTFVVSATGEAYRIECSSKHNAVIKEINMEELTVRTNHGFEYPDAGYIAGEDFLSSKMRKVQAEKLINTNMTLIRVMNVLGKQKYSADSPNNMFRTTDKMNTTGQIGMDLTNLMFCYRHYGEFEPDIKEKNVPENYTPKIDIKIVNSQNES